MARREDISTAREQEVLSEATALDDVAPIATPSLSSRIRFSWLLSALFRRSPASSSRSSVILSDLQDQQEVSKAASVTPESPTAPTPLGFVVDQVNQSEESQGKGALTGGPECEDHSAEVASSRGTNEWASTVDEALQAAQARDAALARDQEKDESRGRARGMIHALDSTVFTKWEYSRP